MIPLDQNYKEVPSEQAGVYEKPEAGGHIFKVLAAESGFSKTTNVPMITLDLDIADGKYAGAFEKYPAKYYQLCNGDHTKYLKGMLMSFYESNGKAMPNVVLNNQINEQLLIGLTIGGCLREEEYLSEAGELKTNMKIVYLCDIKKVINGEISPPALKKLPPQQNPGGQGSPANYPHNAGAGPANQADPNQGMPQNSMNQMPPSPDDDLPF